MCQMWGKKFLWRACHDILPTRRKITNDPTCPLCGPETETTVHILWQCPSAADAWSVGCAKLQKRSTSTYGLNFYQVVEDVLQRCSLEEIKLLVGIARRLWLRRSDVVFGGNFVHPNIYSCPKCRYYPTGVLQRQ
jgi:hypothetical protein